MAMALVCTVAVAVFAFFDGARGPAAAVGADPGVEPWREEPVALVDAEAEELEADSAEPRPREAPEQESDEPEPVEQPAMEVEPPEPTVEDIRSAEEPR